MSVTRPLKVILHRSVTMNFKAVIFDMGGVIMNYSKMPYISAFFDLAKQDSAIVRAWADLEEGKMTAKDSDAIFGKLLEKNPKLKEEMKKGIKDGANILSVFDNMEEDPTFAKALASVKAAGYRTALLTNNAFRREDRKRSIILENALHKFDVVVESCRVGIRKPNPKIYLLTAEMLNLDPKACIFVDDFAENCQGAQAVGMTSVQVQKDDSVGAVKELERLLGTTLL